MGCENRGERSELRSQGYTLRKTGHRPVFFVIQRHQTELIRLQFPPLSSLFTLQ